MSDHGKPSGFGILLRPSHGHRVHTPLQPTIRLMPEESTLRPSTHPQRAMTTSTRLSDTTSGPPESQSPLAIHPLSETAQTPKPRTNSTDTHDGLSYDPGPSLTLAAAPWTSLVLRRVGATILVRTTGNVKFHCQLYIR